jgi:ribosome-binding factor A
MVSSRTHQFPRSARLNAVLQQVIAETIEKINDEELGFLTVKSVSLTKDMRAARVDYHVFGNDAQQEKSALLLETYKPMIMAAISKQTNLKFTPKLHFEVDESIEMAAKIDEVLKEIKSGE